MPFMTKSILVRLGIQAKYRTDEKLDTRRDMFQDAVRQAHSPEGDELAKGTYRPLLAPVNFTKFAKGSTFFTVWYAGPLSIHNNRGLLQTIPSNLQTFRAAKDRGGKVVPADPSLPDYLRDIQFTDPS
jgi:hypothetical protein